MKMSKITTALLTACGVSLLPVAAFAADDEEKAERVEVIGSHIKRSDVEGVSPVLSIDRDAIEKSGYNNLQELFEKMPVNGNGTFSTRGNNQDSTANGGSAISLRGLGSDATLVLINGRRVAMSPFAENITNNFVDINSIPMAAIERVEVLKDGASAIYGSDAVAGVINIVLRNDYTGTEVSVGYGNTTDTDADEQSMTFLWGTSDDKGNMTLILDYLKSSTLMNKDRGTLGTANQSPLGGEDFRSSRGFPGSFVVDGVATVDPGCPAANIAGPSCVYDYGPWNLLLPEAERVGLIFNGTRQLSDNIELFAEIGIQHNSSIAQGAPTPLDGDAGLTVPVSHPNNPFTSASTIDIRRLRTVDAGARQWDIESDTMRLLAGLRGNVFTDWEWEVAAQKGRMESQQTGNKNQGWVRTDFLQAEINAGNYNPFGGVYNPADVIDRITTNLVRRGESHLTSVDAKISGALFEMGDSEAMLAAGVEMTTEKVSDIPDDQFQRGLIFGTEAVSAAAARDHDSAFVELALPMAQTLEVQLAGRYDKYDGFDAQFNPKVGATFNATDTLMFRASWGTGFRAPSLAQIGLGPSQSSQFFADTLGCAENPAYCAATDYTIVFSGNPNLEAEESESVNIGVVWQATDALSFTVDYWSIVQDNKIAAGDFNAIYDQECGNQASTICIRNAPLPGDTLGELSRINSGYRNLNEQATNGIDFSVEYKLATNELGTFDFKFDSTYMMEFTQDIVTDQVSGEVTTYDWTGEYEYPEIRWAGSVDWSTDNWGAVAVLSYTGEFEDTPDADFDGGIDINENTSRTVDAYMQLDVQLRFTGIQNTTLSAGVQNLLDEEPPFAIGDGDGDLYGYVSQVHSPRGQFAYFKATYSF